MLLNLQIAHCIAIIIQKYKKTPYFYIKEYDFYMYEKKLMRENMNIKITKKVLF